MGLKKRLKNIGFQHKVTLICLFIGLAPVLLLGTFSYLQMKRLLIERETIALQETLKQEVQTLDYKLNTYLDAINLIVWNESMRTTLSQNYTNNFDMYIAYRDVIDPMFFTIRNMNNEIKSITIYSDGSLHPHGNVLRPLTEASEKEWYNEDRLENSPTFIPSNDGKTLYLVCPVYYYHSSCINIICITIDANSIFAPIKALYDTPYGSVIVSDLDSVIVNYTSFSKADNYSLPSKAFTFNGVSSQLTKDYVIEYQLLSSVPWNLFLYRPIETVSLAANQITILVMIMILVSITIVLCSSLLLSKITVKPLKALSENMALIEQDNLTITVKSTSKDEIGQLIESFTHMVNRLKYLINEVLRSRIAKQEYEMKALQAQINPHFLYNSLSMINSKALLNNQEDIGKMARLLSTFYRTTLNKGNSIITVKGELDNIRSYIDIQRMMHSNSFDVIFDIDEEIYSYSMPNLLIQPLVENAILHGLDHKTTPGKGILTVNGYKEDEVLIFRILDNGNGMSKEMCQNIISTNTRGYGIHNVHQRVQLYCGDSFGLQFTSTIGLGTNATLRILIKT